MNSPEDEPLKRLREVADTMRMALEGALDAAGRARDPAGACALASVLVRDAVRRFTPYDATIRGGAGEVGEGARALDGTWHGHYWVEVALAGGRRPVVIDITADQFGWPPVVCEPLVALRGRYNPGDQEAVDEHMEASLEWMREGAPHAEE